MTKLEKLEVRVRVAEAVGNAWGEAALILANLSKPKAERAFDDIRAAAWNEIAKAREAYTAAGGAS